MKKTVVFIIIGMAIIATVGYKIYNKPHRKVTDEKAIQIDASSLLEAFETDEDHANALYLDKVVEVTGLVSSVESNQDGMPVVYLKTNDPLFGVSCTMLPEHVSITAESKITVRGFCKGYLSDVVLTNCVLIEN